MSYNTLIKFNNVKSGNLFPTNSIIGNGSHQSEDITTFSPPPSTSSPLTDEPLTSTQKLILYIFLGAVGGFIVFSLLRAIVMRILHGPKGGSDPPVTSGVISTISNDSRYNLELERQRMAEDRPVYNAPVRSSQRHPSLRRNNSPYDATVLIAPQASVMSSSFTSPPPCSPIQLPQRQQIPEEIPPPKYDEIFPSSGEQPNRIPVGWILPSTKQPES